MLLDIFSVSPLLQDIIRSFIDPLPKLALVLFVTLSSTFIFVSFGFYNFNGRSTDDGNGETQWRAQDDENEVQCTSIIHCFYYVVYYGLPAGDISELLSQLDIDDSLLWRRVIFDLGFFLWIGVVMMSIVTGLILDTFAQLREEGDAREEILSGSCFICGISRQAYEDLNLPQGSPNFDTHLSVEHNLWNYVYYIAFLLDKDAQDYNGIESYVLSKIEQDSLDWLPVRNSYVIQEAQKAGKASVLEGDTSDD